jgi:hypothetical protein
MKDEQRSQACMVLCKSITRKVSTAVGMSTSPSRIGKVRAKQCNIDEPQVAFKLELDEGYYSLDYSGE